jgi:ligand-binding SRPBCC domain-containing protein
MAVLRVKTDIAAPATTCFDLSRSIDLHLESMIGSQERAVSGQTSGLIGYGQEVTWEARHLGRRWRMTARIVLFDRPYRFVDEMVRGPFRSFSHEHLFSAHGQCTQMTDVVEFQMGPRLVGRLLDPIVFMYLKRLMVIRSTSIKRKAEGAR